MSDKYYFLVDFLNRNELEKLTEDFEQYRKSIGKWTGSWTPGDLEKFALEKGFITQEQYKKIIKSTLM